ncbi:hypothetical protein [Deinococcus rubellus]|uniref:hypothetical protein n=1 Tax=Deinococcus rubellus TaxID=1889240 RepID=UPI0031EA2B65
MLNASGEVEEEAQRGRAGHAVAVENVEEFSGIAHDHSLRVTEAFVDAERERGGWKEAGVLFCDVFGAGEVESAAPMATFGHLEVLHGCS